ncbi:MAG: AAA family ATPase [Bacteroidaceae bacterium]|nr:AAA family ATPase [Bacteroidaceae bacterium]MBQ8365049.1 AAA family ATPase [Bacteroidaceae bacterium]
MINKYLTSQIKTNFPFVPTNEQEKSLEEISMFILSGDDRRVFLLCGYAGTGKTSLVAALVKTMEQLERRTVLLAPTGRAAKVFSSYSGRAAYTIHKWIYRQKSILNGSAFTLMENRAVNTLFIVDEASMIANEGASNFGSGALLDDLVEFVYSGRGCSLLLLGDTAQLPPVGEELSPALSSTYLRSMFLNVSAVELTQVMRQLDGSGILQNATMLRHIIAGGGGALLPQIKLKGFADICRVQGEELIEAIESAYNSVGIDETIILCRSNKRANIYNEGIRRRILYREEELNRGDVLMIVKNNYYWREELGKQDKTILEKIDFIANGDTAEIVYVGSAEEMYGFRFADVTLSFTDYEDCELDVKIMLDTLTSESPSLTRNESETLFAAVWEDYPEIRSKRKRMEEVRKNPYYNALQVKYGYAVTCHKAQGGQWKRVFIDQGYVTPEMAGPDYYRWLYTAFTRASEKLYLVNWSDSQVAD